MLVSYDKASSPEPKIECGVYLIKAESPATTAPEATHRVLCPLLPKYAIIMDANRAPMSHPHEIIPGNFQYNIIS
jgi:hypothetical protein